MPNELADQWPLTRASLIYPSPVAIACGRILRARTAPDRIEACLKAAEILTRYLAAVAVASLASRDEEMEATITALTGNLSFGHFLTTVQEVAKASDAHPVATLLAQGFKSRRKNKDVIPGKTNAALVTLLELRNNQGHNLRNLDEAKAIAIEESEKPLGLLLAALEGVDTLLSKPLFVVEDQKWTPDALVIQRLLLMGETGDPVPKSVRVSREGGFRSERTPYIAINRTCLPLPPWIHWDVDETLKRFALLFVDGVKEAEVRYCTLDGTDQIKNGELATRIHDICSGGRTQPDSVVLEDGRHFSREWADARARIEDAGRRKEGRIDWQTFDQPTVSWFAEMLEQGTADAHATIRNQIVDGRFHVEPEELRQLTLLFGTPPAVRAILQRDVLDLRVLDAETMRPGERDIVESANLIEALRRATQFFAKHTGVGNVAPEELRSKEGSPDYITLREIVLNQILHQDYGDSTAPGQIEICETRIIVFNSGYSLVAPEKLLEGSKSQSRNPLIARALRSIGLAEIAGSGIRAVHRACQRAQRPAPKFESDPNANTFTLTIDWSDAGAAVDEYWHNLVGVHLTPEQAAVLNAIAEGASVTIPSIEVATALNTDAVVESLDFLQVQVLVEQDEANYHLAQHLRERLG